MPKKEAPNTSAGRDAREMVG